METAAPRRLPAPGELRSESKELVGLHQALGATLQGMEESAR